MQLQNLLDAVSFLERTYVGRHDEERLMATISALRGEAERRSRPFRPAAAGAQ
jgi:hypothetical protein